jgi:aminoglycoside phosphotransferase (APT) family kinase protein
VLLLYTSNQRNARATVSASGSFAKNVSGRDGGSLPTAKGEAMESSQSVLASHLAPVLIRLGYDPAGVTDVRTLAGGLSGSGVYGLRRDGVEAVLKTTLAEDREGAVMRARREVRFYQHLASHVPLCTPTVLAMIDDKSGVALLFPAYLPPLPAEQWTREAGVVVASELARLHAQPWEDVATRPELNWLERPRSTGLAQRCEYGRSYWDQLEHDDERSGVFRASSVRAIRDGLERAEELARAAREAPITLCHGDCHRENILHTTDGQFVWADWQEVRLGRGLVDLIFFTERALADGAELPHDEMLQVYREQLAAHGGPYIPLSRLMHAARGAELLSWLLDWPPFLVRAAPERLSRVLERIEVLVNWMGSLG